MPGPTVEKALNRLAKRCGLNRGAYERHVLEPAIRRSEKKHGLTDELSGIAERAMRAARTSRVRTDKGLIRWLENATWRYRQNRWARKLAEKQTPVQATATDRQASERAALEKAAKAREEETVSRYRAAPGPRTPDGTGTLGNSPNQDRRPVDRRVGNRRMESDPDLAPGEVLGTVAPSTGSEAGNIR